MKQFLLIFLTLLAVHLNAKGSTQIYADASFEIVADYSNAVYVFTTLDDTDPVTVSVAVSSGETVSGDIVIPSSITVTGSGETTYTVTEIGNSAFSNQTGITSITIPNTVTTIKADAFAGCTGLTTMVIPDSVETIENNVFSGCSGLTMIVIGTGIQSMGQNVFGNCTSLEVIIIEATTAPTIRGNGNNDSEHEVDGGVTGDTPGSLVGTFGGVTCPICYPAESTGYVSSSGESAVDNHLWEEVSENGSSMTIEDWLSNKTDVCIPYTDGTEGCDPDLSKGTYTSIEEIEAAAEIIEVARYNIAGQKINGPQKGINIVVYSDGSIKKLIEK